MKKSSKIAALFKFPLKFRHKSPRKIILQCTPIIKKKKLFSPKNRPKKIQKKKKKKIKIAQNSRLTNADLKKKKKLKCMLFYSILWLFYPILFCPPPPPPPPFFYYPIHQSKKKFFFIIFKSFNWLSILC